MNRVGGEVLPNGQNLLSMTKIIYGQSLRSIYTAKIRMCLYQAISSITGQNIKNSLHGGRF